MKTNLAIFCMEPNIADTVGKMLAEQLDMYYLNTTELFKFDHIPHTIEEFLQERKESGYRKLESGTIGYASSLFNTVVCVDSGVVKTEKNIQKLEKGCYIIYVKLAEKYVKQKLNNAIYDNDIMKRFYNVSVKQIESRAEKMKSSADIKVTGTRKSAFKICSDIIRAIQSKFA